MAALFQIRRGSGSVDLKAGELYNNQTERSLQIGIVDSGTVVTLAKLNETNNGSFDISGDLFVSGNATIVGNLTFGNQTSDTIYVTASFGSDLIPDAPSIFNLGSTSFPWHSGSIRHISGSTITYTSITGSISGAVNGIDIPQFSASVSASIGNLNNASASHQLRIDALEQHSSSVNTYTASVSTSVGLLQTFSSSQYKNDSSSFDTRISSSKAEYTSFSGSFYTTINNASSSAYSTYAKLNASNIFTATQIVTGSVFVSGDLVVQGSSSLQNITASAASIGTNTIILNTATPAVRFGGISVIDSGSGAGVSGSLWWDSLNNVWVYQNPDGAGYASARLIAGPKNLGSLGNETGLTIGQIPVAIGDDHISDSIISASATRITIAGDLNTTGNISSSTISGLGNATAYSESVYNTLFWPTTGLSASLASGSHYDVNILSASVYDAIFGLSPSALSYSIHQNIYGDGYSTTGLSGSISSSISNLSSSVSQSIYDNVWNNVSSVSHSIASASALYSSSVSQSLYDLIYFPYTGLSASISQTDATQTTNIIEASASAWGAFQSASAYSSSVSSSLSLVSASLETSIDLLSSSYLFFSGTQFKTDSSSFDDRINAIVQFEGVNLAGDNIFIGDNTFTKYITGSISGAVDGIDVRALSNKTGSFATTGSNTFSASQNIIGDITASGNLFVSGTIYAYELHTIIESASVIFSSGSTNLGDQQSDVLTITGSLYQTGSTSFSELTGSLFDFSASLNSRIGTVLPNGTISSSAQVNIYELENYANYSDAVAGDILVVSASAWGAYTSASAYSASLAASITGSSSNTTLLSQSLYFTDTTQSVNITTAQNSANGAFASASAYSASIATTDNSQQLQINALNTNTISASVVTALSTSVASRLASEEFKSTIFATTGSNQFKADQSITGSLIVTGDVVAYSTSDERLKDNIKLISNPIEKVNQLRGVEFDWNDKSMFKAGKHDYGVIAQDVEKVLPELVKETHTGYLGVDYDKMIGLLIEVVKEQEKRIKDLENKIGS